MGCVKEIIRRMKENSERQKMNRQIIPTSRSSKCELFLESFYIIRSMLQENKEAV